MKNEIIREYIPINDDGYKRLGVYISDIPEYEYRRADVVVEFDDVEYTITVAGLNGVNHAIFYTSPWSGHMIMKIDRRMFVQNRVLKIEPQTTEILTPRMGDELFGNIKHENIFIKKIVFHYEEVEDGSL